MSVRDLPGIDQAFAAPLRRLEGFGLLVCAVPSRGAAVDAVVHINELAARLGRAVRVEVADQATPAERRRAISALNVARDRLAAVGTILALVVLDGDLPMLAEQAPDLWSVRTEVARHARLRPPPPPYPRAFGLAASHPLPPALDAATAHLSLHGLHVEIEGGRVLPPVPLEDLYQQVDAVGPPPEQTAMESTVGEARELLTRYPVAVLEGDAGSGKSTVLKAFARRLARAGQPVVLVSLARLDAARLGPHDLEAGLATLCEACPWGPTPAERPWLLLDGLDEIAGAEDRERVALLADDLVLTDRARRAIVSSRPDVLRRGPGTESITGGLTRIQLRPLSDRAMHGYLERWAERMLEPAHRTEHLARLLQTVGLTGQKASNPRLHELCRRPLFLAAVSVLAWSTGADLTGEFQVLDAFVEALIHRRKTPFAQGYSAQDLRHIAGVVAWRLHTLGAYAIHRDPLVAASDEIDAAALDALRVGTGLLVDDAVQVQFVHAALQDVLVAAQAVDRLDDVDEMHDFVWPADTVSVPGRLFAERMAAIRPTRLAALVEKVSGKWVVDHFDVIELVWSIWRDRPPFVLRATLEQIRVEELRFNRDPDLVRGVPAVGFLSAYILTRLGALGDTEFIEIDDRWSLARWPVTNRIYAQFIDDDGYGDRRWWSARGWRWRHTRAQSRPKDRPERWGLPGFDEPGQPVCGLSAYEAAAFVRWARSVLDRRMALPPAALWSAVAAEARFEWILRDDRTPDCVGGAVHLATPAGVEDLGGLVRQWLQPAEDDIETYAGFAFSDPPIDLVESVTTRKGGGRRWYHPFGMRLALDRARG